MSNLKILVWQNPDGTGQPDVEARVPTTLARWVPRLMKFVPKETKEKNWGKEVDFDALFGEIETLVKEASEKGESEILDVKMRDSHVKMIIEK